MRGKNKVSNIEISIVMAEYNTNKEYLEESINSILKQSFSDFEFLIIDDGTKNDLKKIVDKFKDDRIKIIKNKKNMGLVYSLNRGIKEAKGKYIVRMDTDDIALPNRIEKIYNFIKNNSEYSVVGSKAIEFDDENEHGIIGFSGEIDKHRLMCAQAPIHPTVIMNRDAVMAVGGYPDYKRAEDFALWSELLINDYRIYILDEVLLKYRVNNSDYNNKRKLKYRKQEIIARKKYYKIMGANINEKLFIYRSILAGLLPFQIVKIIRNIKEIKK